MYRFREILSSECRRATWIGYKKVEGTWKWSDGDATNPVTTRWGPGKPNNAGGADNCGEIMRVQNGKILLNDYTCSSRRKFLCEVEL